MKSQKAVLIDGPIGKMLVRLTIPMAIALLGIVAFNLIDTFFVGKLGTMELAAMGFTFPVVLLVTSISLGLGVGASSTISKAIGEQNSQKIKRLATDSLLLSFIIVVILAFIGILTIRPLFRLLGAGPEILPIIEQYMRIWYLGVPFVVIPMVGNNVIRATGDAKTPMTIMLISVGINIVLDPLLIFGPGPFPRLEIAGAALATVIARVISMVFSLAILIKREKMVTTERASLSSVFESWKQIIHIGLPAAVTNLVVPFSMGFVTRLVSAYGPAHVAGLGVATRIEMFVLMIIGANASILIPFVGQNWGAGQMERVKTGVKYSHIFSLAWAIVMFLVFLAAARPIARIFNGDPDIIETVRLYLVIVSISYGFFGVMQLSGAVLNALNKPIQSTTIAAVRMLVLYIPLSYLGSKGLGVPGIFGGAAIANIIAGIVSYLWLKFEMTRVESKAGEKLLLNPPV